MPFFEKAVHLLIRGVREEEKLIENNIEEGRVGYVVFACFSYSS